MLCRPLAGRFAVLSSLSAACVAVFLLNCVRHEKWKVKIGPDVRADIVVLFGADTPSQEIETFWREVLQNKRPDGRGYEFRSGVMSAIRCPRIDGHDAIAINFHATVVQARRDELLRSIEASPLVYMTFQDAVPMEIRGVR